MVSGATAPQFDDDEQEADCAATNAERTGKNRRELPP
jgi:hypothetical protein